MGFRIKGSHIIAVMIAGGLFVWMATGNNSTDASTDAQNTNPPPISKREANNNEALFKVRYIPLAPQERRQMIMVRGRTSADGIIPIRAETGGVLEERFVNKGDVVKKGDLVCQIEAGVRAANVAQATAQLEQAEVDYKAHKKLAKRGFAAKNRLASLKAGMDAARAGLASAKQELGRTKLHANANGIVQDPIAQVGDMLSPGTACITLVDNDPMLFTGQISERDIGKIQPGMPAEIRLIDGQDTTGKIRYIAQSADPATRTFTVEIELDEGKAIRDGMTAEAHVHLAPQSAFRISPSWLTLGDDGTIGIRIIGQDDKVIFRTVKILSQEQDGFWIEGPRAGDKIITLGQEYVDAGEKVEAKLDQRIANLASGEAGDKAGDMTAQ